jgi:vitamin B12 transporter
MVISAACALCAALSFAPSPSPSPSATPRAEIAHVYTSDRADVTLRNTARTIYIVTRDHIVRNGYRTVAEALTELPALQISPLGPLGSSVNYTLRGSNSAQILVLIDGLPAPGSFSNSVELGNLSTSGVDRIEVVEGGGSTLYGTGAIGGIVNIITQRSATNSATLHYGSFADRELDISSDHLQFSRIVSNNGFSLPGGGIRSDVDYESSTLHAGAGRKIGSLDAALRIGLQADHVGAPGPDNMFVSPTSRENDLNQNADLTLTKPGPQSEATLELGGTRQDILYWCSASDVNCLIPAGALSAEGRVNAGIRNAVRGANEQLLYGADFSRGVVRSDSGGFATPPISVNALTQTAAYVQERIDAGSGSVYAGLRGERDGALGGELSPSAGFVQHIGNDLSLKGNLASAFRAPNAAELYFPGYGNPQLKAERATVADFTITDAHVLGGASITWFGNRTNNLIYPDPSTFALTQADHALIEGLTLSLGTLEFNGFTTSLNMTDLYRAHNLDTGSRLPNDPVISAHLRVDYISRTGSSFIDSFGAAISMVGSRGNIDVSLPTYDRSAPYTNVNGYLRMRAGRNLLVTLRGYNLGNERYAAVSGYPMPGRSFALELSTQ